MGNLFCKQTSTPATSDLSTAIDPTGTNFLHGSSTRLHPDVTDCEMWFPVTHKNLDKMRMKKQTKTSIGEPTSHVSAPEGHIAENTMKTHPGLYQKHSKHTLTKLVNKDQNMKLMKKHKTNKKQKKQIKRTVSYMNPNFDPDMLNMHDLTQFHQQVNHLLTLLEIKLRNKKTKNDKTNRIPNTINNQTKFTKKNKCKNKKSKKTNKKPSRLNKIRVATICAITGGIIHIHEGRPAPSPTRVPVMSKSSTTDFTSLSGYL